MKGSGASPIDAPTAYVIFKNSTVNFVENKAGSPSDYEVTLTSTQIAAQVASGNNTYNGASYTKLQFPCKSVSLLRNSPAVSTRCV